MSVLRLTLSPRLAATASLVVGGGNIADIGTDHAYLPTHLILINKIPSAIAADIRKSPLMNAKDTAIRYDIEKKIDLRLSDGLEKIEPNEVKEIVFAGMGGTLIAEKLRECPWAKDGNHHFIFQPQSRANDLRAFLYSNGFEINKELAVCEGNRFYIALDAYYTGKVQVFTLSDTFIGKLPHTVEAKAYLKKQIDRYERRYNALKKKGEDVEELKVLLDDLKGFVYG